jgi:hypothetical protein
MNCPKCSYDVAPGARFCAQCGYDATPVSTSESPATLLQISQGDTPKVRELERRLAALEARVPNTKIIDAKFWTRAVAVWGHSLAVVAVIYGVLFVLVLLLAGVAALFTQKP